MAIRERVETSDTVPMYDAGGLSDEQARELIIGLGDLFPKKPARTPGLVSRLRRAITFLAPSKRPAS